MDNNNLHKELKLIGNYMVSQIRREMTMKQIKATGDLYNSLTAEVVDNVLDITSKDYGSVILGEGARPKGGNPSRAMVSRILDWTRLKNSVSMARGRGGRFRKRTENAKRKSAYAIASSIMKNGVKGSRIIQDVVLKAERRIEDGILRAYKSDITEEFEKTITRINSEQNG